MTDTTSSTESSSTATTDPTADATVGDRLRAPPTLLRGLGVVWILVVSWWIGGLAGVGVGLAIALTVRVAQPVVAVAIAHAGLLILLPTLTTLSSIVGLVLFELGLLAVLLSERPFEFPTAVLTVAFGIVLVTTVVAGLLWAGHLAATGMLLTLVAVVAYGIHRYERVTLGLVVDEPADRGEIQ